MNENIDYEDLICADTIERLQNGERVNELPVRKETTVIIDAVIDGAGKPMMVDTPARVCEWIRIYGNRIPEDYKVWIETERTLVTTEEYVERHKQNAGANATPEKSCPGVAEREHFEGRDWIGEVGSGPRLLQ